ncbi:hypothetical protein LPJ59_005050, partial [Coemansia sp. RSA 2399]
IALFMPVCKMWYRFLNECTVLWCTVDIRHGMYKSQDHADGDEYVQSLKLTGTGEDHLFRGGDMVACSETHRSIGPENMLRDTDIATIACRAGPALSKLSLDFAPRLSNAGISALIRHNCTHIRHLELRANKSIGTNALVALVESVKDHLEFLSLRSTEIDDSFVQALLTTASRLTHLDISFCRKITKSAFPFVDQNNSGLVFTSPADIATVVQTIDELWNDPFANIRILSADGSAEELRCAKAVDATRLPKLKTIIAFRCVHVGSAAVMRIIKAFGQTLEALDVSRNPVTVDVLQQIPVATNGRKPLRLQTLRMCDLDHNADISNGRQAMAFSRNAGPGRAWSFADFALAVPNLTSISLGGKNNCTTNELVVHISRHCRLLVSVDVHGSSLISRPSMVALSENCPLLEHVDISGCLRCDDHDVCTLVTGCKRLKSLNLSKVAINDHCLFTIGDCLRGLERLTLDSCLLITWQGVRLMVKMFNASGCDQTLRHLSFVFSCPGAGNDISWCKEWLHPSTKVTW